MILYAILMASFFSHCIFSSDVIERDILRKRRSNFVEMEDERNESFFKENSLMWAYPHVFPIEAVENHCRWHCAQFRAWSQYEKILANLKKKRGKLLLEKNNRMADMEEQSKKQLLGKRKTTEKKSVDIEEKVAEKVDEENSEEGSIEKSPEPLSKKKRTLQDEKKLLSHMQISDLADGLWDEYKYFKVFYDGPYTVAIGTRFIRDLVPLLSALEKRKNKWFTATEIVKEIFVDDPAYRTPRAMRQNYVIPVLKFLCHRGYIKRNYEIRSSSFFYRATKKLRKELTP